MQDLLKPIKAESLKEVFVSRFEELILSGRLSIGQKLPSERELALQLYVSRPVVHEGLVALAAAGLVTLKPRVGAVVNDYRRQGSVALLTSLFNYQRGQLAPEILNSVLSLRLLFEVETARLAALNRTDEHLQRFRQIVDREAEIGKTAIEALVEADFEFHHLITLATGNLIYPLLLNSMKSIYTNLTRQFFADPAVVPRVFAFHREMATALAGKDDKAAVRIMRKILKHGEKHLMLLMNGRKQEVS